MKRLLTLLAALALLFGPGLREFSTDAEMVRFRFQHSGMHPASFYCYVAEQTEAGWQMVISLIGLDEEYVFPMAQEDVDRLDAMVHRCGLWEWNGFEKYDLDVCDGEDFQLSIEYADGKCMEARGSNAFPQGYDAAADEINAYFEELYRQHGVQTMYERMK